MKTKVGLRVTHLQTTPQSDWHRLHFSGKKNGQTWLVPIKQNGVRRSPQTIQPLGHGLLQCG
jgi:hypothetical protein